MFHNSGKERNECKGPGVEPDWPICRAEKEHSVTAVGLKKEKRRKEK